MQMGGRCAGQSATSKKGKGCRGVVVQARSQDADDVQPGNRDVAGGEIDGNRLVSP